MAKETVEHPAFAGRHMDGLVTASEQHARVSDYGDVNAQMRAPVIVNVDVRRDFPACSKAHEAAAAPNAANLGHDLPYVIAAIEAIRGGHGAIDGVAVLACRGDQAHGLVANEARRVRGPCGRRK